MKSIVIIVSVLLGLCLIPSNSQGQNRIVRIASPNYPPLHNKLGDGLGTDIITAAFTAVGYTAIFDILPPLRASSSFMNLSYDGHSPGDINLTPQEREKSMTVEYGFINIAFVYYVPNLEPEDLHKLKNFTDITQLSNLDVALFQRSATKELLEKSGFKIHLMPSQEQLLKFVQADRAKLTPFVTGSALLAIKRNFPLQEATKFALADTPILSIPFGVAFHRQHPNFQDLSQSFANGIEAIKRNGQYIAIYEQYFGASNVPKVSLTQDMKQYGADSINIEQFMSYKRDESGKIIL